MLAFAGMLAGCAAMPAGDPSPGIFDTRVSADYLPLQGRDWLLRNHWGAAFEIAPGIAVTNAHNANLVAAGAVLAVSRDYDLLFFRSPEARAPSWQPSPVAPAQPGEPVIAYGQFGGELRQAEGVVRTTVEEVAAQCAACPVQHAIGFDAEAGPGFSGGPLVDRATGAVLGVVFGYRDGEGAHGGRRMFAYDMALVRAEMARLLPPKSP